MAQARQRELPGRQPAAARAACARTCSRCTASRGWSTTSATRRRRPAGAARLARGRPRAGLRRRAPSTRCSRRCSRRSSACALPREPFERLIEANRRDQRVAATRRWSSCCGYCALSADPVGRARAARVRRRRRPSGSRCRTGLHRAAAGRALAGRRRGLARGRIYLPAEDLRALRLRRGRPRRRHGRLRRSAADRVRGDARAARCSRRARRSIRKLRGAPAFAVAAFVAGGRAALRAIERAGYDVLGGPPRARAGAARSLLADAPAAGGDVMTQARRMARHGARRPTAPARRSPARGRATSTTASACCRAASAGAMCAVYAFARRVDDIGDGHEPDDAKLGAARAAALAPTWTHAPNGDPMLVALRRRRARFALPAATRSTDLIDGVEMDVRGDELRDVRRARRCTAAASPARSAGCAWRSSARPTANGATALADDLGVAMQLTNILRDVREDSERGRVYLPAEDLRRFGCADLRDGAAATAFAGGSMVSLRGDARRRVVRPRARSCCALLDRRSALLRGGDDRHLPADARAHRSRPRRRCSTTRVSLPPWEKAWVAIRSLAAARRCGVGRDRAARDRGRRRPRRDHRGARLRRRRARR